MESFRKEIGEQDRKELKWLDVVPSVLSKVIPLVEPVEHSAQ